MTLTQKLVNGFAVHGAVFAEELIEEITTGGLITEDHLTDIVNSIIVYMPLEKPTEVLAKEITKHIPDTEFYKGLCDTIAKASADSDTAKSLMIRDRDDEIAKLRREVDFYKNQLGLKPNKVVYLKEVVKA